MKTYPYQKFHDINEVIALHSSNERDMFGEMKGVMA